MVSLTISNLTTVNFVVIISFMFIFAIIIFAIKYLFIGGFSQINFIHD